MKRIADDKDGKIDLDRTDGTQVKIKFKRTTYKPRI
jgi:two-component sensor histidine kinase